MSALNALKKFMLEKWLEAGMTQVIVNAAHPGVQVLDYLKPNIELRLNLSKRFGCFMELDGQGVQADLSFNGKDTRVVLPWDAIWAIRGKDGNTFVFPVEGVTSQPLSSLEVPQIETKVPEKLESIDGSNEVTPPRRGHLKLVN